MCSFMFLSFEGCLSRFEPETSFTDLSVSWCQPAIDALTLALMREFNSLDAKKGRGQVQPLVYGTFQAYLRR